MAERKESDLIIVPNGIETDNPLVSVGNNNTYNRTLWN